MADARYFKFTAQYGGRAVVLNFDTNGGQALILNLLINIALGLNFYMFKILGSNPFLRKVNRKPPEVEIKTRIFYNYKYIHLLLLKI
jgi:hypothetical protein